ncbi:MAG: methylmalonyl-CoA mutase family protein [Nannocystaceae bacterium]
MPHASDGEAPTRPSDPPTHDLEAWRARAREGLGGVPLERLQTRTRDGIAVEPLFVADNSRIDPASAGRPGSAPFLRGAAATGRWQICPRVDASAPTDAAADLRSDLERGADAIWISLDEGTMAGGGVATPGRPGVEVCTAAELEAILAGLDLTSHGLVIDAGVAAPAVAIALAELADRRGVGRGRLRATVGGDLLATAALRGGLGLPPDRAFGDLADLVRWSSAEAPGLRTAIVSTIPYADAGATASEELALLLAGGLEVLRQMERRGLAIEEVAPRIHAATSIGRDLLLEVAKLRAARLLWSRMIARCGGSARAQALCLHAEGSWRELSTIEPWGNLLRGAAQACAGAIAGAASLATLPFTAAIGLADADARRLAINTQLLLREESHLDRTIDAGGGAFAIESLTDALARAAWTRLQAIEAAGGLAAGLVDGSIQATIAAQAAAQAQTVATTREAITGVSRFASVDAPAPAVTTRTPAPSRGAPLAGDGGTHSMHSMNSTSTSTSTNSTTSRLATIQAALAAGATLRSIFGGDERLAWTIPALERRRLAEPFEALRAAGVLRVPLLCVGARAALGPRIDFMRATLASGGIACADEALHDAGDAALADFVAAPAPAVILCAADLDYPALVPALIPGLRAAGARLIALAGRPRDQVAALTDAGVDLFFSLGADVLEPLRQVRRVLSEETAKEAR